MSSQVQKQKNEQYDPILKEINILRAETEPISTALTIPLGNNNKGIGLSQKEFEKHIKKIEKIFELEEKLHKIASLNK